MNIIEMNIGLRLLYYDVWFYMRDYILIILLGDLREMIMMVDYYNLDLDPLQFTFNRRGAS